LPATDVLAPQRWPDACGCERRDEELGRTKRELGL
jgi:hypothetical protein